MLGQGLRKSIDRIIDNRKVTTTGSHSRALRPLHVNSRMSHFVSRSSCSSARPHLCVCVLANRGEESTNSHSHTHTRGPSPHLSPRAAAAARAAVVSTSLTIFVPTRAGHRLFQINTICRSLQPRFALVPRHFSMQPRIISTGHNANRMKSVMQ